jgi:MFS family permease
MVLNVAAGSLGLVYIAAALGFPAPLLLESLEASGTQIGLLASLQHILLVVQIPAAWLVGRLARRKGFWFCTVLAHRLLWCLPGLLPFVFADPRDAVPWILGVVALSTALDKMASSAWLSWMADLIPDRVSGRFWSIRQSIIYVSYLVGTLFYSWCLDHYPSAAPSVGFAIVFVVASVFGSLDILVHAFVPEPPPHRHVQSASLGQRVRAPLADADFRWLTLAMGAWLFTVGLQQTFSPVYCKQVFGYSFRELAGLALGQNVGVVLAGLALARPLDRFGGRACAAALVAAAPLLNFGWFYPGETGRWALLVAMHVLLGGLYSGVLLAQLKLLGAIAPRRDRVMAMAVHWTLVGTLAALGPVLGGWIKDIWPAEAVLDYFHFLTVAHMALACGVCLMLFLRLRPPGRLAPSAPALEVDPGQVGGF